MRAFTFSELDEIATLRLSDIARPKPSENEVLIQVKAAGVTPSELLWYPTTHLQDGTRRVDPVPGHEFSGVVVEVGEDVTEFTVGEEVFGMNDWFAEGATAEYCVASVVSVVSKPAWLGHIEAAAAPISALTAWQGLVDRSNAKPGDRVLIVGAAGAVGLMAVQIAIHLGCHVIASASECRFELLRSLGVQELIDYRTSRFENMTHDIDVVFDAVGGNSLQRAERMLKECGRMVTIAADAEGKADPVIAKAFFIVEPSAQQLKHMTEFIQRGQLKVFVKATIPFERSPEAYLDEKKWAREVGKLVVVMEQEGVVA